MGWAKCGLQTGLFLSLLAAGCQNKMYDENKALYDENKALRDQNDRMRQQQALGQQQAPAQPVVVPQPAPQPAPPPVELQPQPQIATPKPVEQIGGLETTINKSGNTVVQLPSDVFFDSGAATLKQSSKSSLDKVVSALRKQFGSKQIVVQGHTDDQPIRVSKWASNQELSVARADAVKQYLIAHDIEQERITTKGLGDTKPRGADRAKNRRVEIVVMTGSAE